ncbi:MAG: hypothetical protein ACRDIU_00080 [Actinomycetota bacterium]
MIGIRRSGFRTRAGLTIFGGVAIALAVASLAFACTVVQDSSSTTIQSITWNNPQSATKCAGWGDCAMVGDALSVTGVATNENGVIGKDRDFMLHFLNRDTWDDSHETCMGALNGLDPLENQNELPGLDQIIGGPSHSDATTGAIPATTGLVPGPLDTTSVGLARVCFIEVRPSTAAVNTPYSGAATKPDTLEIVLL